MKKYVALLWFLTLTVAPAWGDGPVPVSLVHDPDAPNSTRFRTVSVHAADGEPLPFGPAEKPRTEPPYPTLSAEEAMNGLAKLSRLERPFDDNLQFTLDWEEEYALLSSTAAPHDIGGLASMTALHHLMREFEKAGGDPFMFGRFTAEFVNHELSGASASFLEQAFRSEFEKAARDPANDRFHLQLIRCILHSGFASPKFAAWIRDQYLSRLFDELTQTDQKQFLPHAELRLLAHAGVLDSEEVRKLLNVAASALFQCPENFRYMLVHLLQEITVLPGFDSESAAGFLEILNEAWQLDPTWKHRAGNIVRAALNRFDVKVLFPADPLPDIVQRNLPRPVRYRTPPSPPPDRVHARVSKIQFPSVGNPVVVESFSRSVGSPTWEFIRCGSEQSAGTVSLRYTGGKVYCSFHCGQRFGWDMDFKLEPNRPQFRRLPRHRLYFKPGEDWSNFQDVPIFDMLFLELGAQPFGDEELQPSEILKMAAASFENDTLLKMAFFKWMEVRPHADLRPLLFAICQMQDYHETGIDAAKLLVKRNELSAFQEMIPSLLNVHKSTLPTPIMDVFLTMADHPKIAPVMKQAWAAEIIRTHLNGPLGEWKAMSIMKVAVRLSGESFGFEKQKSGEANMAAFERAQKWAWKNQYPDSAQ